MRSLCAALAVIALLALAGCGGSSPKTKTTATATTATSTTSDKPSNLTQARRDRLDQAVKAIVSAVPVFVSKLQRCVPAKRRTPCVKRAARPAEAAVSRSRSTFNTFAAEVGGTCSTGIEAMRDRLTTLTEDLRAVTVAAQSADTATFTKVGAGVQQDLRVLAAASLDARTRCT
jgi:hypothetical protein